MPSFHREDQVVVVSLLELVQSLRAWTQYGAEGWDSALECFGLVPSSEDLEPLPGAIDDTFVQRHLLPASVRQLEIAEVMTSRLARWRQALDCSAAETIAAQPLAVGLVSRTQIWLDAYRQGAISRHAATLHWAQHAKDAAGLLEQQDARAAASMIELARQVARLKDVVGISTREWIQLTHRQFNAVRDELSMPAIPFRDFVVMFAAGASGARSRYFRMQ